MEVYFKFSANAHEGNYPIEYSFSSFDQSKTNYLSILALGNNHQKRSSTMGQVVGKMDGYEQAKYDVVEEKNGFEIRQYATSVAVDTKYKVIENSLDSSESSNAFRRLAGYIGVFGSPNNESKDKIAMTSPVISSKGTKIAMTSPVLNIKEDDEFATMTFILPSKYTFDTAPTPKDPTVTLRNIPQRKMAAVRFKGTCTEEVVKEKGEELLRILKENNIQPISNQYKGGSQI